MRSVASLSHASVSRIEARQASVELRRLCQKPRASASSKRSTIARAAFGLAVDKKIPHRRRAKGRVEEKLEMVACDRIGQHRESKEMIDRLGDFGGAAMAVAHLPGDPARIARPGAHNPGDFLAPSVRTLMAPGRAVST